MAKGPATPTTRRRRLAVDLLLFLVLLTLLAFLFLSGQRPYLTEKQALTGTQAVSLYGPGKTLARAEYESRVVYLLRDGNSYALCRLSRPDRLFWSNGYLNAVTNDPDYPMMPLINIDNLLVICNDPDIAQVELVYYIYGGQEGGFHVLRQTEPLVENCWLFPCHGSLATGTIDDDGFLLRGYDANGTLLYETAVPEVWTDFGDLTIPEAR